MDYSMIFIRCYYKISNFLGANKYSKFVEGLDFMVRCCVFLPGFGCWVHPQAVQNTFLPFSTFFVNFRCLSVTFHPKTSKNIWKAKFLATLHPKSDFLVNEYGSKKRLFMYLLDTLHYCEHAHIYCILYIETDATSRIYHTLYQFWLKYTSKYFLRFSF